MIYQLVLSRLLFLFGAVGTSDIPADVAFRRSLTFKPPAAWRVSLHRFWQPVRESRGLSGKLATLIAVKLLKARNADDYKKVDDYFAHAMAFSSCVVVASMMTAPILNNYHFSTLAITFLCIAATAMVTAVFVLWPSRYLVKRGRVSDARWLKESFYAPRAIGMPTYAFKRVQEFHRNAHAHGATFVEFARYETKFDPILEGIAEFEGKTVRVTLAVYDKPYSRRYCE